MTSPSRWWTSRLRQQGGRAQSSGLQREGRAAPADLSLQVEQGEGKSHSRVPSQSKPGARATSLGYQSFLGGLVLVP